MGTIHSPWAAAPPVSPASAVARASNSAGVNDADCPAHRMRTRLFRSTTPGTSLNNNAFSAENMAPHTVIAMPSEATTVATCAGARSN